MTHFYAFNGDADGICALQQLYLANPIDDVVLITGLKRDISLLKHVEARSGDDVTVLDISLDKNRDDLKRLLDVGARVRYFDHHFAGDIPEHVGFNCHIDTAKDTCTSLLVDNFLNGQHRLWAIAGAFGDNFSEPATRLAQLAKLNGKQTALLKTLGEAINYNGYGATLDDLHITPQELALKLRPYASPFDFIEDEDTFRILEMGYVEDMNKAESLQPIKETPQHAVYELPCQPWARRVSGVFANQLANQAPNRAHAILTKLEDGGYLVSVRAPISTKTGADELCRQFPTGGGRQAAAGINNLPEESLEKFTEAFLKAPFA